MSFFKEQKSFLFPRFFLKNSLQIFPISKHAGSACPNIVLSYILLPISLHDKIGDPGSFDLNDRSFIGYLPDTYDLDKG